MTLKKYQTKRKFEKTPEPKGRVEKTGKNRFVIHEHWASHHHFDFRLEMPSFASTSAKATTDKKASAFGRRSHLRPTKSAGKMVVLKSWAVPKGLPEEIGVKRLAVQVEDHPIDYINFHGVIPAGQYGAGKVEIFDKGKYKLIEQNKNKIIFELRGKKIKGPHALIKMKNTKNWLIYKVKA